MKVTAIKAAVKTPGRFNVFIDGEYSFSLNESQILETGIRLNKEYSKAEIKNLKNDSEFGKAYARALDYIVRRPRSEKEIRDYAFRKKWEPRTRDQVIKKLLSTGYLNDEKFAESWVRNRALGKPISERKLRLELRQKGVELEIIEKVLKTQEYFNEEKALKKLIEKKRRQYDDEKKLINYLLRQGFGYSDIKSELKRKDS
jgi:regulatory protein